MSKKDAFAAGDVLSPLLAALAALLALQGTVVEAVPDNLKPVAAGVFAVAAYLVNRFSRGKDGSA